MDVISTAFQRTHDWLKAPFTGQMDAVHIFLLVGLVIVSIGLWTRILAHLPKE